MFINFKSNAKIEATKIYLLSFINRKFVNKIFNKLHKQNYIKFNNQFTVYNYLIFVI